MYGVTTLITSSSCGPTNLSPSFLWFGQKKLMYSFKKKKVDVQKILETKLSILVASFSTSIQSATNYVVTYLQIPYSLKIFKNPLMILSIKLKLLQN